MQIRGHIAAIVTVLVWGTTYVSTKVLLQTFTPVEILFTRFCIGILVLLAVKPKPLPFSGWRAEVLYAGAGLTGVTLYYLLENVALEHTLATNVGTIILIAPFITGLLSQRLLPRSQKLKRTFYVGFVIAMAGVILLEFGGSEQFRVSPLGDFLALLAALVWSMYSIITKRITDLGADLVLSTRRMFAYAIIFMIPALIFAGFDVTIEQLLTPVNLGNLAYLGVFACALCFLMWNYAVASIGAVKTSIYIYATPIITYASSVIILGEPVTTAATIGITATLLGLILSEHGNRGQQDG